MAEHFKAQAGEDAKAICLGAGLILGKKIETKFYIPFRITGSKKGFSSAKGKEIKMFVSFCPFCGEKIDEGTQNAE